MDYRRYAIDELRSVGELRAAEKVCLDRLVELDERLQALKVPSPQADPVSGGGSRTEERWLNLIAAKADEERRLREIRRRLRRFDTAWAAIGERDRRVLEEWYIVGGRSCAERVAAREYCDERTARRWRDDALVRFARAYYGAVVC